MLGGRPIRLARVAPAHVATVQALLSGEALEVCAQNAEVVAALLDRDFLEPLPAGDRTGQAEVTAVIPVRDHLEDIATLLGTPNALAEAAEIVVVDDASSDPDALDAVVKTAAHPNVRVVRMGVGRGPAAARNFGARLGGGDLIAFVDADCMPEPGWMTPLLAHFDDADVGAVAPRVRAQVHHQARTSNTTDALLAFESARGPLDLGPEPGSVGPGHRVLQVPSAALVVRRAAFTQVGGFDERFDRPTGEDTDIEWRMARDGWTIRYEPSSVVRHPIRPGTAKMLRQRYVYGLAEATLADRHPGLGTLRVEPANLGALVMGGAGYLAPAALVGLAGCVGPLRWWQRAGIETNEALRRSVAEQAADAHGLSLSVWTRYWPLTVVFAVLSRRFRKMALGALVAPALFDWMRRRPGVPISRWAAFHVMDQLAAGAGIWVGCLRARSVSALLPRWAILPQRPELVPPPA